MSGFLLGVSILIGVLVIVGLHRVRKGPTVFDRVVAIALVTANSLAILIVVASYLDRVETIIDIALSYALLTFVLPIALGKYFEVRGAAEVRSGEVEEEL